MPIVFISLLFNPYEKFQFILFSLVLVIFLCKYRYNFFYYFKKIFRSDIFFKFLFLIFVYQLFNFLFALFCKRADILTFPLFIISFWLAFSFLLLPNKKNYAFIRRYLKLLITAQGLIVIFQGIATGNFYPGDWPKGLLSSANWTGFSFFWLLFTGVFEGSIKRENILIILFSLIVIFFTDAKTIIVINLLFAPFVFIYIFAKKMSTNIYLRAILFYSLLALILFFNLNIVKTKKNVTLNSKLYEKNLLSF